MILLIYTHPYYLFILSFHILSYRPLLCSLACTYPGCDSFIANTTTWTHLRLASRRGSLFGKNTVLQPDRDKEGCRCLFSPLGGLVDGSMETLLEESRRVAPQIFSVSRDGTLLYIPFMWHVFFPFISSCLSRMIESKWKSRRWISADDWLLACGITFSSVMNWNKELDQEQLH